MSKFFSYTFSLFAFTLISFYSVAQISDTIPIVTKPIIGDKIRFQPDSTQRTIFDTVRNISAVDTLQKPLEVAKKKKRHSPTKAALFSALLPGLGQGYNKKYWKIPIVYAGLAGLGFGVYYTGSNFINYRNAYRLQIDENPLTIGSYKGVLEANALKSYRDYYKRLLDITAICTGVWYLLNIVDAAVDAHLFDWNMRNDLNVSWRPEIITPAGVYPQASVGASVRLRF